MDRVVNYVGGVTPGYNLGDEALYMVDKDIFAKYPFQFSRILSPFRQQHSQTTIVGGGTVLPVIAMLMRPVKYAYIFGAGVLHPAWNGPFSREVIDRFKLINFRFVGVRGNISKRLLKDWGIDSEVIGDPCLSLRPKEVLRRVHNRVAINVGIASPRYSWGNRDRVLGELAKVCEVLNERGFEVILIPFWEKSLPDIERLSEKTGAEVFWNWQDLDSTLNLISTSKVFIGEKLHSLVFSAAVNTPFIGLAYAPAHFDFVDSVGFSKFTTKTTEISGETVIELFNELLDDYDQIQFRLKSSVDKYREKQIQFSQKIHSDLESLSSDKWALGNNNANTLMLGADFFFQARLRRMWGLWSRLAFTPLAEYLFRNNKGVWKNENSCNNRRV